MTRDMKLMLSAPTRIVIMGASLLLLFRCLRFFSSTPWESWTQISAIALFSFGIAGAAISGLPQKTENGWRWTSIGILWAVLTAYSWGIYLWHHSTWAAWIGLAGVFVLVLDLEPILSPLKGKQHWAIHLGLALLIGTFTVATVEIEANFSDEEFFAGLEAIGLSLVTFIILSLWRMLSKTSQTTIFRLHVAEFGLRRGWIILAIILASTACTGWTIQRYQASFYTPNAQKFPGIDHQTPFLCAQLTPNPKSFEGRQVFQELIDLVAKNPNKRTPEFGMLALSIQEPDKALSWAQQFRTAILEEADQDFFTGPANSVKSTQFDAALRIYYYSGVRTAFPDLFSSQEDQQILKWFTKINRRSLQTEWVDWLYGIAFSKPPEGPYENQENGAGLFALLETGHLFQDGSPFSRENRDYLKRNPRGWLQRFRNTDDAYIYQTVWIINAYFQSFYQKRINLQNRRNSFEWLLLQALPDGAPLGYNHPALISPAGIGLLGARLLEDKRYIWLAGQAIETLDAQGRNISATPGAELPVNLVGESPTQGSCLLFGESGLPNQYGPLAPDKIVLRTGWSPDSLYALLNLRFSGWHRYKATNSLISVYQEGPLLIEDNSEEPLDWLPVGRSLFRDKRIPRQNLNGLLVGRSGFSAVLYDLTGIGSPWAQDPPTYATVADFQPGEEYDYSRTLIENWRGWTQSRSLFLFKEDGPLVVIDMAERISDQAGSNQAGLAWNLPASALPPKYQWGAWRISLRDKPNPAELIFLDVDHTLEANDFHKFLSGKTGTKRLILTTKKQKFKTAAIFLIGDWVGAEVAITPDSNIQISQGQKHLIVSLQMEQAP